MLRQLLHRRTAARSIVCIALLSYVAAACHTWQVESAPLATALSTPVSIARVSLVDDSKVMLRDAHVASDSLVGRSTGGPSRRIAIPLAAVRSVELEKVNVERSAGWGILLVMVTGATVALGLMLAAVAN